MELKGTTRLVVQLVLSSAVNGVITNIIKSSSPIDASNTKMFFDKIGGYVISNAISSWAIEQTLSDINAVLTSAYPEEVKVVPEKGDVKQPFVKYEVADFDQDVDKYKGVTVDEFARSSTVFQKSINNDGGNSGI